MNRPGSPDAYEQATITLILRDLLNSKDGKELMNIISSDPKRFYSIVTSAIKTKKQQQEILESVEMYLVNVMNQSKKIDQKVNGIKNTIGKIALAGSVLVATSIGLVIGGFALPVLLVPATIAAVKYGPVVGKKLGGNIAKNSTFIQRETNSLERIKTVSISTAQTISKTVTPLSKDQIKSLTQNVDTNSVKTVQSQDKETNSKTKTVLEQKAKSTDKGKQI